MIKKRTRPQPRVRSISLERENEDAVVESEEEGRLPLADLIELRKLRRAREGIDVSKLNKGDAKKKKKRPREETEVVGGLKMGVPVEEEDEEADKDARARRVVRNNNFTQQTNALDVDKHMMAYIEENLKIRSRPREEDEDSSKPSDPREQLFEITERWKVEKQKPTTDEGSVTNSMAMLTAIPEVDLGMDTRLKNIAETEKAKRVVAEHRHDPNKEHLAATRFYRPHLKPKSDADILRDAKLEAMGLPPQEGSPHRSYQEKSQTATDEMVMERFKKRMRK
ncbi:hepatocellular carcinoma-associated antigen 59-domain-containing protein [Cyathus striatus]|nr:hepatocellular carcinoma-associated antigen 59-domain-containing protein [Cyathus striatus]